MEANKISFSFSKLSKKPTLIVNRPVEETKVDFIECLEGQSIKVKDAVEISQGPLIIPIRDSSKKLLDRIRESKQLSRKVKANEARVDDEKPDSELTLDELAAKQLLQEATNTAQVVPERIFKLPSLTDKLIIEGSEESTLDDYADVPISDYGLAMLRGMGWSEGSGIGKNQKIIKTVEPELRPKGMGLGASKMVNVGKKAPAVDENGKELSLIKGACAKIIAGQHKGCYCEVLGLDEEAGRVIVKTTLKSVVLSLNEFLLIPVTQEEYMKSSKVINNAKYEEYNEKSRIKKEHGFKNDLDSEPKSEGKHETKANANQQYISKQSNACDQSHSRKYHRATQLSADDEPARRSKTSSRERDKSRISSKNSRYQSRSRSRSNSFEQKFSKTNRTDKSRQSDSDDERTTNRYRARSSSGSSKPSDSSDCTKHYRRKKSRDGKRECKKKKSKKSKKSAYDSSSDEYQKQKHRNKYEYGSRRSGADCDGKRGRYRDDKYDKSSSSRR